MFYTVEMCQMVYISNCNGALQLRTLQEYSININTIKLNTELKQNVALFGLMVYLLSKA